MKRLVYLGFLLFVIGCGDKVEKEIAKIPVDVKVDRFEQEFFEKDLGEVKGKYPYLFPAGVNDSVWVNKKKDTLQRELYKEVSKRFGDFGKEKKDLEGLFRHVKYYFPKFKEPRVITMTTDVDYRNRVIYADSLLLVGLDNYLGKEHKFYEGMSHYIKFSFERKYLDVDVAKEIADVIINRQISLTFLDAMVIEGKKLYLMGIFLPEKSECELLKYQPEKYDWAVANESEIWRYFIENKLLYDTDKKTLIRFIDPAPFSKFYMELDSESPGEVGRFIGYRIVKAYMERHPDERDKMLIMKAEDLFNESKYKPNKE